MSVLASNRQPSTRDTGPLQMPVKIDSISSPFGWRIHPILHTRRFHDGIDIPKAGGTPVQAMASGEVISAGWDGAYGLSVKIQHPNGIVTRYSHLAKGSLHVAAGSVVNRGDVIGGVGRTGWSTGNHLHLSVFINGNAVDPVSLKSIPGADLARLQIPGGSMNKPYGTIPVTIAGQTFMIPYFSAAFSSYVTPSDSAEWQDVETDFDKELSPEQQLELKNPTPKEKEQKGRLEGFEQLGKRLRPRVQRARALRKAKKPNART